MDEDDYQESISNYHLGELLLVAKRIDRSAYPERYQLVLDEINKRKRGIGPPEPEPEPSRWTSSSKRWLGIFLYAAGVYKLVVGIQKDSVLLLALAFAEALLGYYFYRSAGQNDEKTT